MRAMSACCRPQAAPAHTAAAPPQAMPTRSVMRLAAPQTRCCLQARLPLCDGG